MPSVLLNIAHKENYLILVHRGDIIVYVQILASKVLAVLAVNYYSILCTTICF